MSDLIDTFPGLNKFFLNTLWVSSRGDDENPGFFPGKPKRTFTAALAAASDASRNAETVNVDVDGVVYKLTLDDLKSWVTA